MVSKNLGFTSKESRQLLRVLSSDLFAEKHIPVYFVSSCEDALFFSNLHNDDTPLYLCGEGNTISYIDTVLRIYIGCKELCSELDDFVVDDDMFVKTVVAMHHEQMHVMQVMDVLRMKNPTAKYVALSCFSSYIYPDYHNATYSTQADEIQAEYYGVLRMFSKKSPFLRVLQVVG